MCNSGQHILSSLGSTGVDDNILSAPVDGEKILFGDSYIFNKKKVNILFPEKDDVVIDDIARALSNTCRYNGHTNQFYSVAQHSLIVAYIVEKTIMANTKYGYFKDIIVLRALLHDAHEAYLGDMIRPMKNIANISSFIQDLENRWDRAILAALMPYMGKYEDSLSEIINIWEDIDAALPEVEISLYLSDQVWDDTHMIFKKPFFSLNLPPDLFAFQSPEESFHKFMQKSKTLVKAIEGYLSNEL